MDHLPNDNLFDPIWLYILLLMLLINHQLLSLFTLNLVSIKTKKEAVRGDRHRVLQLDLDTFFDRNY